MREYQNLIRKAGSGLVGRLVLFQLFWYSCVTSADSAGLSLLMIAVLVAALAASVKGSQGGGMRHVKMVVASVAAGLILDSGLSALGLFEPARPWMPHPLAPLWLLALWGGFGLYVDIALSSLHGRSWAAALLGAIGGPAAYAQASRLGAIQVREIDLPWIATLAAAWALTSAALFTIAAWNARREAAR